MAGISSDWTSPESTTLAVEDFWLSHPTDHTDDTALDVPAPFSAPRTAPVGVFYGLQADGTTQTTPTVVSGPLRAAAGSFGCEVIDPAVRAKLRALYESRATLLLRSPFLGEAWWIQVTGLADPMAYADGTGYFWNVSVDFVEVARP